MEGTHPEAEPGWQRTVLPGSLGRGESSSRIRRGTPAACCWSQAGSCCRPGMPQRGWGRRHLVQPFQQMVPPLLWEQLPAPSWVAPGGWGRALRGRTEVLWCLTLGIAVLERDLDPRTPVLVSAHRALEGRRYVGVTPPLLWTPLCPIPGVPRPCRIPVNLDACWYCQKNISPGPTPKEQGCPWP